MKARVKATGELVEVQATLIEDYDVVSTNGVFFTLDQLELKQKDEIFAENCLNGIKQGIKYEPDYWEKLLHQYVGMAMNALLLTNNIKNGDLEGMRECNTNAMAIATALVNKLKGEHHDKERTA